MGIHDNYDETTVTTNSREIIIPLFRLGVADYRDGWLRETWEWFKGLKSSRDWKRD